MLGMLVFCTVIVIYRNNYFSESKIGQSYQSQYSLYNVDTMEHITRGKMAQGVGAKWSNSIFFIFLISQEYDHICSHFVIEYKYCHSLSIPAKYHDDRLVWFLLYYSDKYRYNICNHSTISIPSHIGLICHFNIMKEKISEHMAWSIFNLQTSRHDMHFVP